MRKTVLATTVVAVVAIAGCGGDTTTVINGDSSTSTTSTSASDTTSGDINQQLIDQFAKTSGGQNLANICKQMAKGYPRSAAYRQGVEGLAPLITKQGGDISVVVNGLLDRC